MRVASPRKSIPTAAWPSVAKATAHERLIADALLAIHDAQVVGTWPRLKVCANDTCRWAFYDASRNRTGAWCSMAECGNRAKAQRFRSRRQASSSAQASQ